MDLPRYSSHVSPSDSSQSFFNPKHSFSTMTKMYEYFLAEELSDVTLIAGGEIVKAHRIVLSAISGYFAAMFRSNMLESRTEVVNLKEVDGGALKALVTYAYTGQITLLESTVETIFCAASLLGFLEVVEACSTFLKQQIAPTNCIGISLFADAMSCDELKNVAVNFIAEHFLAVIEDIEFLTLSPPDLTRILLSEDLNVPSETSIFKALMKWINFDKLERQMYIGDLLPYVKLPLLSPSFLSSEVLPQVGKEGRELVIEAFEYHLLPEKRPTIEPFRTTPRKSTLEFVFAIAGSGSAGEEVLFRTGASYETYNPRLDVWENTGYMPTRWSRRVQHAVATFKQKIFVVGGRDGLKTLTFTDCYNVVSKTWSKVQAMGTPRHGLGLAAIQPNGPLYAVGGHDGWSYLSSVERWDPETESWSYVQSLSTPRSTVGVAVLNNKIYAVGGRDGVNCLNLVEVYDPHTNRWKQCTPMHKRRGGVAVAVLSNLLYAFGGHDNTITNQAPLRHSCVERYDPNTDTWTLICDMSTGRDGIGVAVLGTSILTAGGFNGETAMKIVELYNPLKNEWTKLSRMTVGRAGPFLTAVTAEEENCSQTEVLNNEDQSELIENLTLEDGDEVNDDL